MTTSLRFNPPPPLPGTNVQPKAGMPLIAVCLSSVVAPLVFVTATVVKQARAGHGQAPRRAADEVPRAFRTVHPLGWAIWKGDCLVSTEEELLTGIQGRSREDGDRDVASDRPRG